MNTLEKYLRKEEILEKFLNNLDLYDETSIGIDNAFTWIGTIEGENFWLNHYLQSKYTCIDRSRIEELLQERIPRFRKE